MPGAPSRFLLLVAMPGATSCVLHGYPFPGHTQAAEILSELREAQSRLEAGTLARATTSVRGQLNLSSRVTQSAAASTPQMPTAFLLGTKGIATRSKDITRGSWPYY